jgi:hypothetical protein
LHPRAALQLFAFDYPVNAFYRAVKEELSPTIPETHKIYLAVFRHEDVIWRMELSENEHHLLQKIFADQPIGQAIEALQSELSLSEEELIANLSEWFGRWMRNGLLAARPLSQVLA